MGHRCGGVGVGSLLMENCFPPDLSHRERPDTRLALFSPCASVFSLLTQTRGGVITGEKIAGVGVGANPGVEVVLKAGE